jgi:hypothetical protein
MKTPKKLTKEILNDHIKTMSSITDNLCKVIDTLTDDDCNALPCVNEKLVKKLQKIAYNLYKNSELMQEDKIEIITQFEEYSNMLK